MKRSPLKRSTKPIRRSWIKRKPVDPERRKTLDKAKRIHQKDNPFSAYWRDKATDLWSKIIRIRANGRCEYTGKPCEMGELNAHHILQRGIHEFRCDLSMGMAIKTWYHTFDKSSPHGSQSILFYQWLERYHPEKYKIWMEHKNDPLHKRWNWKEEHDRLNEIFKSMFRQKG